MVSATKTNISAPEMPISATEMRQSKVKESKVKNSKVNTTLEVDTTPVDNSDDGSVDGLDFDNNLIPKKEAGVSVMPVAEEVDCFGMCSKRYIHENAGSVYLWRRMRCESFLSMAAIRLT